MKDEALAGNDTAKLSADVLPFLERPEEADLLSSESIRTVLRRA